jgi:hypothetical protein
MTGCPIIFAPIRPTSRAPGRAASRHQPLTPPGGSILTQPDEVGESAHYSVCASGKFSSRCRSPVVSGHPETARQGGYPAPKISMLANRGRYGGRLCVIVNITQMLRTGRPVRLGDASRMLLMIVPIAWPGGQRGAGFEGPAAQGNMVARAAAGALVIEVARSNA